MGMSETKTVRALAVAMALTMTMMPLAGCKGKDTQGSNQNDPKETVVTDSNDSAKKPVEKSIFALSKVTYHYDLPEGDSYEETVEYTLDEQGNPVVMKTRYSTAEITYDEKGYETKSVQTFELEPSIETSYTNEYDEAGRLFKQTNNEGTTTWEYDSDGSVSKITKETKMFDRNGEGEYVEVGTMKQTTTYTSFGFPAMIEQAFSDGSTTKTEFVYQLDNNNLPKSATVTTTSGDETRTYEMTYEFDKDGNLITQVTNDETVVTERREWVKVDNPSDGTVTRNLVRL